MVQRQIEDKIVEGFRKGDSRTVRDFFYPYCRIGYSTLDRIYDLHNKPEMDFMSLAHEYYIRLQKNNFKTLDERKETALCTWMTGGLRYLVLDRLKALSTHRQESFEERLQHGAPHIDIKDNTLQEDIRHTVEEICDSGLANRRDRAILYGILLGGFKGREMAVQLGITPSAVTQRYHRLMEQLVKPYFLHYFVASESLSAQMDLSYMEEPCLGAPYMEATANTEEPKKHYMDSNRITPNRIDHLKDNEVFVFGSNLAGMHGGGAAWAAMRKFGAVMGQGVGRQGQSYAIPTMQGGPETIQPYVNEFIAYAKEHTEERFLVTRIGCGIAGFNPTDIAPLFVNAVDVENISLPKDFWEVLE